MYNSSTHDGNLSSHLLIQNVSLSDKGFYECLVADGLDSNNEAAMTTISKSGNLHIIGMYMLTFQPESPLPQISNIIGGAK